MLRWMFVVILLLFFSKLHGYLKEFQAVVLIWKVLLEKVIE